MQCLQVKTSKEKDLFLNLPTKLYERKNSTQDYKTEMQILNNCHPLSNYFEVYPYIVLNDSDNVVSRAVLTVYPDDKTGYVGFFESVYSQDITNCLLDTIKEKAISLGLKELMGPVDSSFWIKYRFKVDHFENYYTNEPYNKEYYQDLWERWGFKTCNKYYSNQMRIPTNEDNHEKCKQRLELMKSKGYTFRNTSKKTFDKDLRDIFNLMKITYSKFAAFKEITEEEFVAMYSGLNIILNYNMVHLAYKDDKLVGFFVAIPNYKNALNDLNMLSFIDILNIKRDPKEFILLYMGGDPHHPGLGGALSELAKNYLQEHNCTSVGALIQEGNISGGFYKNLTVDKYHYVLMKKDI